MNIDIKLHRDDLPDHLTLSDNIAIDCEFMGLNVDRDRLCLVQISTGNNDAHIIKLNRENYNAPNLKKLLENNNVGKIFHFARFDMAVLRENLKINVKNIFCTKIASKLTRTYSSKHGLKDLINEILDIQLDKTEQTSDWSKKKLTKKQISYAINDVLYLSEIKISLNDKLINQKRIKLFKSIMKFMETRVDLDLQGGDGVDIFAHK